MKNTAKNDSAVLCGQASTGSSDAVADTDSGGTSDHILSFHFGGFSDGLSGPAYLAAIYFADLLKIMKM